jgi:hypothetical protein
VHVVRGVIRIFALRKAPFGVPAQRQLIRVLEFAAKKRRARLKSASGIPVSMA